MLNERVEIHWIEIPPLSVRKSCNVARRDGLRDPLRKASALLRAADVATALRDVSEPPEALARQRLQHGITYAKESLPRRGFVRCESLTDLGERHGSEIEHSVRGEQIEVRHCLVRAGDDKIDLIRFRTERRVIAGEHVQIRHVPVARSGFEGECESLDRAKTPGDPRREKWIDERVRVWHQRPPLPGGAR